MNKAFWTMLALGACVLCPQVSYARPAERIVSYHSDIRVNEDATMDVVETIRVRAEGEKIRHGIYRDFPTKYRDRFGNNYSVDFETLDVRRDGQPEGYHFGYLTNGKRIYFGKQEILLYPGVYTYTFCYRTSRQIGFFKDHDELYWNVTGNGWEFPIDEASATIELPAGAAEKVSEAIAFTGPQGARGQDFCVKRGDDKNVAFTTTRPLGAAEGLTIVVSWPKGFVREPSVSQKLGAFLLNNIAVFYCVAGFLLIFFYYMVVWLRFGRDPRKGTIIPLYAPPHNLSPAAIRCIFKMGYDYKAFSAAVVDMAVKGVVRIKEISQAYSLEKTGAGADALSPDEAVAAGKLFEDGPGVALKNDNYMTVQAAVRELTHSLRNSFEKVYFLTNSHFFVFGLVLSLFFFFGVFFLIFLNPLVNFPIVILTIFINILFYRLLKAPTLLGRKVIDQIEGFRMYLSVAEKNRLNILNPPQKTPELFEKYLPYALALDVEVEWAEQFSDVFARLHETQTAYAPAWYVGSGWSTHQIAGFTSHLSSSFSHAVVASSTPPGSSSGGYSGGGGGGFSGGGGGGGGGGGW